MIGEAIRYQPICRALAALCPGSVLEVGSKGRGMALIHSGPFVGLDLVFPPRLHRNLTPVSGSVLHLPFASRSYDVVVCSDVLEHLEPKDRQEAVREMIRVARCGLVLGFPSGEAARRSDHAVAELYKKHGQPCPPWLEEHLHNTPVDTAAVEKVITEVEGARFTAIENQSLRLGQLLARLEFYKPLKVLSGVLGRLAPSLTATFLTWLFDKRGPYARAIYTVTLPGSDGPRGNHS